MFAPRGFERHVSCLQPLEIAVHHRPERRVDRPLNIGNASIALAQLERYRTPFDQLLTHARIRSDISPAEAIDRLLGIAHDEQLAREWDDRLPARLIGII